MCSDDGAQDLDFLGTDDEADGQAGDDVDDDVMDDLDDEVEDDEAAMTAAAADDADMEEEILVGEYPRNDHLLSLHSTDHLLILHSANHLLFLCSLNHLLSLCCAHVGLCESSVAQDDRTAAVQQDHLGDCSATLAAQLEPQLTCSHHMAHYFRLLCPCAGSDT